MSFLFSSFLWLLLPLFIYWFKIKNQGLKKNLQWFTLALLLVALARPVVKEDMVDEKIMLRSFVIALDLSVSMNANDVEPSRYEASYLSIKKLLQKNKKDKIALLGFTINALMLSPPTTDHRLLLNALDTVNREYILTKGTSLRRVFEKVSQFKDEDKILILFSDGGDELIESTLIDFLQEHKIEVVVVAMGTKQGATIALEKGKVLSSKDGKIVVSKRNEGLERLAEESGGIFIVHDSIDESVDAIEMWLREQNTVSYLEQRKQSYKELALFPIVLALIFIFISATKFSRYIILFFLFIGMDVSAEDILTKEDWGEANHKNNIVYEKGYSFLDDYYLGQAYKNYNLEKYKSSLDYILKITKDSLEEKVMLAYNYYKLKQYKKAKNVLKSIKTTNKKVKKELLYALGNCEAHLFYYDKAKNYYIDALKLSENIEDDEDILYNLEQVFFKLSKAESKVGAYNPSTPERVKKSSKNGEESKKVASKKGKKESGAGEGSKKVSNNVTFKLKKSPKLAKSKAKLSSRAYDLINKGYIREHKPW